MRMRRKLIKIVLLKYTEFVQIKKLYLLQYVSVLITTHQQHPNILKYILKKISI